jgi:hypothetical protein
MRRHSLPHGWGRGTRQSFAALENDSFQLTEAVLCGIYVTEGFKCDHYPVSKKAARQGGLFSFQVLCGRISPARRIAG